MNFRRQPLTTIGGYSVCKHAIQRLKTRFIRESELLYTLDAVDSYCYQTHSDRTIVYNNCTGISVIVDNQTGIIITITETDERKQRMRLRKKLAVQWGTMKCFRPPPPLRCA